jgi:sodium transport system permease protein
VKPANIGIVYRKELTDTLRDRRTLISSILVPILLFPVLILGVAGLAIFVVQKTRTEGSRVMLLGAEHAPRLAERLEREKTLRLTPPAADYTAQIDAKSLRAALEIPPQMEERLRSNPEETQTATIYWYEGELRSQTAVLTIERAVADYREEVLAARLAERNLPAEVLKPFVAERKNVVSAERITGNILGLLLPYFFITLALTGAMYPAMDLTAGEKERGTMETILASPVGRAELVLGKFLLVLTASLVTTALSIVSFGVTILGGAELLRGVTPGLVVAVSTKAAAAVFFILLPLAILFSAALLAIAVMARSYREAQTYLTPLMFVVILPAMAAFLPGVELNTRLALIPILNVSLVSREIFTGQYPWGLIALIFGSTLVYAAAAIGLAIRQFQREEVLFRT